jgi:hypothetical protein
MARDSDEEEEQRNLEKQEKVQKLEKDKNIRLEKFRIKKKVKGSGFARNLKYDHETYMKELEENNKHIKKETETKKIEKEIKIKRGHVPTHKPALVSKGKFMLNSDARAAHHLAEAGLGLRVLESRGKSPTD